MPEGSESADKTQEEGLQAPPAREPGPRPLFIWPNSDSIIREVLLAAQEKASEKLGLDRRNLGYEPLISDDTATALAPELEGAVAEAVKMYDLPDRLLSFFDEEVRVTAKQVMDTMPVQEFNRLVEAVSERLQEQ